MLQSSALAGFHHEIDPDPHHRRRRCPGPVRRGLSLSAPGVDVTEVVHGPVVEAFYATGTVSPEHEYSVRANVAGIIHLSVDKGSKVKRGQVLAVVDNADLRFSVDQAKAELHRKQQLADDSTSPVLLELRAKLQATDEQLQIARDDEKRVTAL